MMRPTHSLLIDGGNNPWQPILPGDSHDHEPFLTAHRRLVGAALAVAVGSGYTRTRTAESGGQIESAAYCAPNPRRVRFSDHGTATENGERNEIRSFNRDALNTVIP